MLEKWNEAVAMIMVARFGRQGAGNGLSPPLQIGKTRIIADLGEFASRDAFERDNSGAVRDSGILSIL